MIKLEDAVSRIRENADLSCEEAASIAKQIFAGGIEDRVVADFLILLAEKGETGDEIAGFASELMSHVVPVSAPKGCVDLCGTGGSGLSRFNVSTAAAFVVSACGIPVAKHGNRGSRQPNGSFDLLEALGLPSEISPDRASDCLESVGLAFLYARRHHPIMKNVVGARKLAARRTIFNLLGPLCNPAPIEFQVIGTAGTSTTAPLACALMALGRKRALIVTGDPGIDEVSVSGNTYMLEVAPDTKRSFVVSPEELGIVPVPYDRIPAGNATENAKTFQALLRNESDDSVRDMVSLAAATALYVCGHVSSISDGFQEARRCIAEGHMRAKFDEYKTFAQARATI